ncbi:PKD domain-containing protein [Flaviaesturariibacter flavus]|uniref:PKD domain-containing protein n=1 Tax=Flaviaesturariibacter flavus TaxID=2502780 RepID=A0A4R1B719_9BACT|nr:PKD domain-containing protein [Flaviaesturariibacter flavus]TCJ12627.1 PKD domain-containing protein [Flaviaesturariibacter flavus]
MKKILALGLGMLLAFCGNAQSASDSYANAHGPNPGHPVESPDFVPTDSISHTGPVPAGVCPGLTITLHALHSPQNSTYQWTLNGTPVPGATDSILVTATPGDYSVIVVNGPDTYNWPTLTVVGFSKPVPDFSFSVNNQCSSTPVSFTNLTAGAGNTYSWNFADPNSGAANTTAASDPTHWFAGSALGGNQSFPVKLYATNNLGCIDSVTKTVNTVSPGTQLGGTGLVVYNGNPVFTSCTSTGATLTFQNQSSTAATNLDYRIIWGDATPDFTGTTMTNVNHSYSAGTWTLQFIVSFLDPGNGSNCRDTGYYTVFVGSNPAVGLSNPGNTITCSESALTFPITSTGSNSPGTNYTVSFNDGSAPINFSHPAPASISHTFNLSSCGTNSQSGTTTYQNAFSATIRATNPCGSSSASIVPIYVSKKPKAAMSIGPNDTVCTNINVNIVNTSGNMSSVSNGVCTPGKGVWTITPATGWTVTGATGTTNSSSDPAFWTGGSNALNVVFTAPGTYQVRLQVGNTQLCGTDEIVQTICVNGQPVSDFTLSTLAGCGPVPVTATNLTAPANCNPNTFAWTVSYTNPVNCQPATSNWNFTGGTAANSPNPAFNFVNPGVYTIDLKVTPPGNTCSNTSTKTVTVKAKPNVVFDPIAPICPGVFSPVAAVNNCFSSTAETYLWTFTGAATPTSTLQSPTATYPNPGTFSIQLDVTNECGTTTVTQPVQVNPTPAVDQPADIVVCNTLTAPATNFTSAQAGLTFNWTNSDPSIGLAASGTGNIPAFTAINTGNTPKVATITVTPVSTTCSGPSRTFTITVNPTPPIDAGDDQILCNATSTTMAAVLASGTTGTWTQISTGPAATITSPTSPTTTITGLTPLNTYQFKWTVTGTGICNTVSDTVTVLNRPLPTTANAGPDTLICGYVGGSPTLPLRGNPTTHPWELGMWTEVASQTTIGTPVSINNPGQPVTTIDGVGLATGLQQGVVTLVWTISNDAGCTPSRDTLVIRLVRQPVAGTLAPLTPLCYNNGVTVNASGYTGNIVGWERKDAPLATNPWVNQANATPAITLTNLQDDVALQFIVAPVNALCLKRDTVVGIIPVGKPIVNVIGARIDSVCSNTLYNSNSPAASGGNNTPPVYQWESSLTGTGFTTVPGANSVSFDFSTSQTIWLRRLVTIGGCSSVSDTIKVWVEDPISNNTISGNQTICINTAPAPLTGSVPNGGSPSQPLTFQWESSTNGAVWTPVGGANSQNFAPGVLTQTTYFRRIVRSPRCPSPTGGQSNIDTVIITPAPVASFVPSPVTGCSPLTVTVTNNTSGAGNTYTWNWGDLSANTVTTSNAPIQHVFTTGSLRTFTISLTADNSCGMDTRTIDVTVQPNSVNLNLAVSSSQLAGCAPHKVMFYNSSPGGTAFTWNFNDPPSPNVNTTNPLDSIEHIFNAPGTYHVTLRGTNNCSDTTGFVDIVVYAKPTAAFTPSSLTACVGNPITFTNNSTGATNYLWKFINGTTVTTSSAQSPSVPFNAAGTYTVRLIAFNTNAGGTVTCTDSTQMDVTIGATQTGSMTVSGTSSACAPFTVDFTNNTTPNTSVLWNFADPASGAANTSSLNTVSHTFNNSGTYAVTLSVSTAGGCTFTSTRNITVGGPSGTLTYTGGYKCNGQGVQLDVAGAGATSYTWDFGNAVTQTTTAPSINYTYPSAGVYLPKVTLNGGGCAVVLTGVDSVRIERMVKGFTATFQQFCDSTRINFQDTSAAFFGKASIRWTFGGGNGTATGASPSLTLFNSATINVMMVVTSNSGCTDTTRRDLPIAVWNTPNVTMSEPPGFTGCARQQLLYEAVTNSADPIANIQWSTSNGVNGTGPRFRPVFGTPGVYTITLTVSTVNGCTRVLTSNPLTINPSPTVSIVDPPAICRGGSVQINSSATGATSYSWSPSAGLNNAGIGNPVASPDSTTNYILTVTNSAGCSAQASTVVTVIQPITLTVRPASDSLCLGDSLQLFASGATSFTWSANTPNPADLRCTTCPNPVFKPSLPGEWTLTVTGTNSCFTRSATIPIGVGTYPSVNLGPDLLLPAGTIRPLTSTVTGGPVTSWLWTPGTDLSCTTCPQPTATIRNAMTYVVTAANAYGCVATDTLNIRTFCEKAQAYIPNAFSPDGDGINDVLMVRGSGIVQVKSFRIFNRWGEVVFERANFNPNDPTFGWDGKVKGVVTPPDVFVYTAEVICENGTTFTYKGNVSVLK